MPFVWIEKLTFTPEGRHSFTIAAPVEINGKRGNVGVVVQRIEGTNRFKTLRILLPIRKILKDHGDESREAPRGQRAITPDDFAHIVDVIMNPTTIARSEDLYMGKPAITFTGDYNGRMNVVAVVSDRRLDLFVQTVFVNVKKGNLATPLGEQAPNNTPEANSGTVSSRESIRDEEGIVKSESLDFMDVEVDTGTESVAQGKLSDRDIRKNVDYPTTRRAQSAFNRSFMNKISGLKPDEKHNIIIYTADYMYAVRAYGTSGANPYVGEILRQLPIDESRNIDAREEYKNGTYGARKEDYLAYEEARGDGRRGSHSRESLKERLAAEGYGHLLADEPGSNSDGDRGQSGGDSQSNRIRLSNREGNTAMELFSDRDAESISNRSLLANAFEDLVQNDLEKKRLREYKDAIDKLNAEELQLLHSSPFVPA